MAQALHAALAFAYQHPDHFTDWTTISNYIVCLNVADEDELLDLIDEAHKAGIAYSHFREGDMDDQFTAAAFQPGAAARTLCAKLPLALKQCALSSEVEQQLLTLPVVGSNPTGRTKNERTRPVDSGDESPDVSLQDTPPTRKGIGGSR